MTPRSVHMFFFFYLIITDYLCTSLIPTINAIFCNVSFVRYAALAPLYYRGAAVAVVVYDITSPESFSKAQYWVKVIFTLEP